MGTGGSAASCSFAPKGLVQKLATTDPFPGAVALLGSDLYWIQSAADDPAQITGSVQKVPKEGGEATIVASNQARPMDMIVAGALPYWANFGAGPSGGSVATPMGVFHPSGGHPVALTADATRLYWAEDSEEIYFASLVGDPVQHYKGVSGAALASDGTKLFAIRKDGTFKIGDGEGGAAMCTTNCVGATTVIVDVPNANVYWADQFGIAKAPEPCGEISSLENDPLPSRVAHNFAIDDKNVYWLSVDRVMWAKNNLGPTTVLVSLPCADGDPKHLDGIAVDDAYVYWAAYGGIWRALKP